MFEIDLADAIFIFCLAVGGGLLLLTVVLDDIIGGLFDALHLGIHVGGISLMPPLLGFVAMFGIGGLIGTQILKLENGPASIVGGVLGIIGFGLVFGMFGVLRRSEGAEAFSLNDLVGQTGRVSVAIPAKRYGSVFISYAGASHNLTATADVDVSPGSSVRVTGIAGTNVIVEPLGRSAT
ncbi:MAG TPA: NfeD family protein [Candidatus Limnocylindria bacterium]|nr:NfeD family protein [Candidatus Limnocylindria bacterium]